VSLTAYISVSDCVATLVKCPQRRITATSYLGFDSSVYDCSRLGMADRFGLAGNRSVVECSRLPRLGPEAWAIVDSHIASSATSAGQMRQETRQRELRKRRNANGLQGLSHFSSFETVLTRRVSQPKF